MAWNPPGSDNKNKKKPPSKLDKKLREIQKRFLPLSYKNGVIFLFFLWFVSGFYIVNDDESAAILTLGRYTGTVSSGFHWIPRFVQTRTIVNREKIFSYSFDAQLLTKELNIVWVNVGVDYRIDNVRDYLFNVVDPLNTLKQEVASILVEVVGQSSFNDVFDGNREKMRQEVLARLTHTLEKDHAGLVIAHVGFRAAQVPEGLKDAFMAMHKAQEEGETLKRQAKAYATQVAQSAEIQKHRLEKEAQADKQQVVLTARSEVVRFLKLLPEYQKAPNVMRDRLYFDAMESVLTKSSKMVVENSGSNTLRLSLGQWVKPKVTAVRPPFQAPDAETTVTKEKNSNDDFYHVTGGY